MRLFLALFVLFSLVAYGEEDSKKEISAVLTRADSIPKESTQEASDPYFEGYIQALVDMHYHEFRVIVIVRHKEVWLANLPKNDLIKKSIIAFVKDVPGVKGVHVLNGVPPKDEKIREKYVDRPIIKGIWFPQTTELFLPMVADPRQVTYSIGYRQHDRVIGKSVIPVSLGDDFPLYRWLDIFWGHGDLQISIETGIWSVFDIDPPPPRIQSGTELKNTDFYVGIPLTYAINAWSMRFRIYHISSHLGDEFLVNNPNFIRVNPSMEAVDFFASYQALGALRLYAGVGAIFHWDPSFKLKPFYCEYGGEFRFCGSKFIQQRLYGTFFIAAHFRTYQFLKYDFDGTFVGGYEWSKLQGIGRKFRVFIEYHKGFSLEGQFMKDRTSYISYLLSYGF
jgi:hypothetical protein